ncbi:MAG: MOSC domain-containing protein [Roseivirga sp.]|nr:MOSC domain-containing protein [Roseivirga sp.]
MLSIEKKSIKYLTSQFTKPGVVRWIGVRSDRGLPLTKKNSVEAKAGIGLEGDHYASKGGKRQVTLIQKEHIRAVASMVGSDDIDPSLLRRNIVVEGLNLSALKDKRFRLGTALLEYTGECHPCSRMEENLGNGGYNAMRSHGGITCRILEDGVIGLGDELVVEIDSK